MAFCRHSFRLLCINWYWLGWRVFGGAWAWRYAKFGCGPPAWKFWKGASLGWLVRVNFSRQEARWREPPSGAVSRTHFVSRDLYCPACMHCFLRKVCPLFQKWHSPEKLFKGFVSLLGSYTEITMLYAACWDFLTVRERSTCDRERH